MQVELEDHMGKDLSVVNAARVSFAKRKTVLDEADEKLVAYLARHDHWSPFAHTCLSFRVTAPIFVARQLAKHQVGAAWNEESRRYIDDEPTVYYPDAWRERAENVKQGSGGTLHAGNAFLTDIVYQTAVGDALRAYQTLLKRGVAPEQARMVLPQATMTSWVWTGSLLFFARVCQLRLDDHSQKETRDVAVQIAKHCRKKFPVSWAALMEGTEG
jgi:thymidylate synthase (FAD)